MIKFELTESEYDGLRGSLVTAKNYYDQEIKECGKVLKDIPDCKLEGTIEYWKDCKRITEEVGDALLEQKRRGGY